MMPLSLKGHKRCEQKEGEGIDSLVSWAVKIGEMGRAKVSDAGIV
jgi:hypothetical protein